MSTVELQAGDFHYVEFGEQAAPPLVLLHGMPSDSMTCRSNCWPGWPA